MLLKRMKQKKKIKSWSKRIFTYIVAGCIGILGIPGISAQAAASVPKNPLHVCIGEDTTDYDTITFGMYPQTQITGTELTDAIINADYDSTTGDAVVDGVTYRRMSRDDATSVINYPSGEGYRYFKWEPVKWKVLEVSDDDIFVMAEQTLDCQKYDSSKYSSVTWETSTLRKWLNEKFIGQAFSAEEQKLIKQTNVTNPRNSVYSIDGGKNTTDQIYILSEEEVQNTKYGFCQITNEFSQTRNPAASDYSYSKGTHYSEFAADSREKGSYWWLRTPGKSLSQAAGIINGKFDLEGSAVGCANLGIIPVMHLKQSAASQTFKAPVHYCKTNHNSIWDTISFGNYPATQVADVTAEITDAVYDENGDAVVGNTKYRRVLEYGTENTYTYYKWEPIQWKVLSYDGTTLYLMTQNAIDCKEYDLGENDRWDGSYRWSSSVIRKWLNETFYQQAFDEKEKADIKQTELMNVSNDITTDAVYLPFSSDMLNPSYGFCKYTDAYDQRAVSFTDYAKKQRIQNYKTTELPEDVWPDEGNFWLRGIKGNYDNTDALITKAGAVDTKYGEETDIALGVVPMIRINYIADRVPDPDEDNDNKDDNTKDDNTKNDPAKDNDIKDNNTKDNRQDNNSQNNHDSGSTTGSTNQPSSDHTGVAKTSVQKLKIELPSKKLAVGKKVKLKVKVTPANASDQTVKYEVNNKKYASINKKGELVLKKAGAGHTVKLTATAQDGSNVKTSCKISIMKHAVKKVKLSAASKTIKAGKSIQLKTEIAVTGKKVNKKLKYISSNTKYATVTQTGVVKAKKAGKGKYVTITAAATDGSNKKGKLRLKIK